VHHVVPARLGGDDSMDNLVTVCVLHHRQADARLQRARQAERFDDDPERGIYWGPPSEPGGTPRRWSRHWFDWRPRSSSSRTDKRRRLGQRSGMSPEEPRSEDRYLALVLEERQVLVERDDVSVMFKRVADEPDEIGRGMAEVEEIVGLRGRKYYGAFDDNGEYRVCVQLREGDDPQAFGLEVGTLPGGRYARVRLTGEPPAIYELIEPTFQATL
jgi:hypothetical protein